MQKKVIYCSQNKIHICTFDPQAPEQTPKDQIFSSAAVERFLRNSHEADTRDNWKSDKREDFALQKLLRQQQEASPYRYTVTGTATLPEDSRSFCYSISLGEMSGIYRQFFDPQEPEQIIISDNRFQIEDIVSGKQALFASVREKDALEAHIAMIGISKPDMNFLTDGDCIDFQPSLSKTEPNTLYYVTSGFGRTPDGELAGKGPQYISRLSLNTMEQEELLADDRTDYWKPKEDLQGNLYYLKRPYRTETAKEHPMITLLAAPFRLLGAIGGALNYFTMRYSGKTLKSDGGNPAKMKQKSQQELFIEGNLVQAKKEYQKNLRGKEPYPGCIPKNWELCCLTKDGETLRILQGVCDYDLLPDGTVVFANGKNLLYRTSDGKTHLLAKTDLPSKLHIF